MNIEELKENARRNKCYVMLEPVTPKASLNFSAEMKKVINERNILTTRTRKCFLDALDEISSKSDNELRRQRKESALFEILTTEKSYIHQLEVVINFFMKPAQERKLLRANDFDILFGNIMTIYNVNQALLQELYKGSTNVATAFSKIAPFFKLYSVYARDFKNQLQFLQNCSSLNSKFSNFLEMQESRPEVQSKLSSLLITPIQRVPRYKLLLKQLCTFTLPEEKDYDSLIDCLNKIEDAADHINQIIKDQENMQRLLEVQRCIIHNEPNIITPGRNLIREGILMKIPEKSTHSQKLYIILMNDIIMFCKMKKNELKTNSLKCSSIFPLNKCKIVQILDKGCFRITCEDEEIVLYHEQLSETLQWFQDIKDSIHTNLEDRKTLRKESSLKRPVKRKGINEYNEIGLSPGRPLKKRRSTYIETSTASTTVMTRPPLRRELTPSPFFITLKPKVDESQQCPSINNSGIAQDLYRFGERNPNRGFTFRINNFFGGVKESLKNWFGFN